MLDLTRLFWIGSGSGFGYEARRQRLTCRASGGGQIGSLAGFNPPGGAVSWQEAGADMW